MVAINYRAPEKDSSGAQLPGPAPAPDTSVQSPAPKLKKVLIDVRQVNLGSKVYSVKKEQAEALLEQYHAINVAYNNALQDLYELELGAQLDINGLEVRLTTAADALKIEEDKLTQAGQDYEALVTTSTEDLAAAHADFAKHKATYDKQIAELTGKLTPLEAQLTAARAGLETQKVRWEGRFAEQKATYAGQIDALKGQLDITKAELQKGKTVLLSQREIHGQLYATVQLPDSTKLEFTLGMHNAIIGTDGKMYKAPDAAIYVALMAKHAEARKSGGLVSA